MTEAGARTSDRPIPAVLRRIVSATAERVEALHQRASVAQFEAEGARYVKRSLRLSLEKANPAIIAEAKKASPSKGVFRPDFDPFKLAASYESGRAAALSVVTEPRYFQGEDAWLKQLREMSRLPILRKDFIIDSIQVAESAALGADAVLLINRILTTEQLTELSGAAKRNGLEVLFEVHDQHDLTKLASLNPDLVGINSRNLDDFSVSMTAFEELAPRIPEGTLIVAESGLESYSQIEHLVSIGYRGFLIGESLIRATDPAAMLSRLRGESA